MVGVAQGSLFLPTAVLVLLLLLVKEEEQETGQEGNEGDATNGAPDNGTSIGLPCQGNRSILQQILTAKPSRRLGLTVAPAGIPPAPVDEADCNERTDRLETDATDAMDCSD